MNFSGFAGNDDIKASLESLFASGRLPHAMILQGEDGLGKHTLARIIARALVCRNKENAPCYVCPSCVRALAGSHPDIREITGSGARNQINVESVRNMIQDAYRKPEEADRNVYLLFAGNAISETAQNKLLKIIEEPPEGAVFVMTIRSADSLLPTIRSRAGIFTLHAPSLKESAGSIAEKTGTEQAKAEEAAKMFSGNIGKALIFLEGGEEGQAQSIAATMAKLMVSGDEHSLLAASAPLIKDPRLFREAADCLELIFRDACVFREGAENSMGLLPEVSKTMSERIIRSKLMLLPGICREFSGYTYQNANMNLLVTAFCAKLKGTVSK